MDLFIEVLFNFVVYSLLGWGLENIYCYFKTGSFQGEGFLSSPFKPMYGISMCILILGYKYFYRNLTIMTFLCFMVPTSVEYLSGYILKRIFNKVYWDYSMLKYNFQGLISLRFSIYWTLLSLLTVYLFQPIIYQIYEVNIEIFTIGVPLIVIAIGIDFLITMRRMTRSILLK